MESVGWRPGLRRTEGVAEYAFRIALACTGAAAVVFGLLAFFDLINEVPKHDLPANLALYGCVVGIPVIVGTLAFAAPSSLLRRTAAFSSQLYLVALAYAVWMGPEAIDPYGDTWLISITAIPAASAMISRPRPSSWLYLPILGTLTALVSIRSSSSPDARWDGLLTGLYAATFAGLFVGIVFVALVWSERLDQRLAVEDAAQTQALVQHARSVERRRMDALAHDAVISTLLVATQPTANPHKLAQHAERTLEQLAQHVHQSTTPIESFAAQCREAILREHPSIRWQVNIHEALHLDAAVADALIGAFSEALRNVQRHAQQPDGGEYRAAAELLVTSQTVTLTVTDSGPGFNVHTIPADRLGIRQSIRGRVHSAGGTVDIQSRPGGGTTVTLGWPGVT